MLKCLQVCKQGCKTVKGITRKSVDWHGLGIRLHGYSGITNSNYLNTLESGREASLRQRTMYTIPFEGCISDSRLKHK